MCLMKGVVYVLKYLKLPKDVVAVSYKEISRSDKENVELSCVPFCIERREIINPDPIHIHSFHQLTIITRGSAILEVNNFSCRVSARNVFVIGSYAPHCLKETENLEIIHILFQLEDLMKYTQSLHNSEGFRSLFMFQVSTFLNNRPSNILRLGYHNIQKVMQLADELIQEANDAEPGKEIVIQSYFMILVTYLSRYFDLEDELERDTYEFYCLIEHIKKNLTENYSLQELTKLTTLSEKQIRKYFTQKYHCSPIQYLNHLRLERAKYYLITTDQNISEIAAACGFDDSNYFSRKFKQEYGVSPREFKRHM